MIVSIIFSYNSVKILGVWSCYFIEAVEFWTRRKYSGGHFQKVTAYEHLGHFVHTRGQVPCVYRDDSSKHKGVFSPTPFVLN